MKCWSISDVSEFSEAKIGTARESVVYEDEEEIDDSVAHDSGFADVEPLPGMSPYFLNFTKKLSLVHDYYFIMIF